MKLPYQLDDKNSIIEYAKKLTNDTLRTACIKSVLEHGYSGKGRFGQILEKFYFLYNPNSDSEPDFPEAGLELKSSPLKQLKNKEYRSKERLVLNIINYLELVNQDFETSSFWKKNAHLLLVFYLHEAGKNSLDYIIKIVDEWSYPNIDLEIIKKDWDTIKQKVVDGKAHELSEGDTFYLGACTKGGKGGNPRKQPNNEQLAKQRVYSLKQGYVNHIIASLSNDSKNIYGKIIPSLAIAKKRTIEDIVISKFKTYYNKSVDQILDKLEIRLNAKAKNFYANLTNAILGIELGKKIEEFDKAEIKPKTIRLQKNGIPKESMSFPAFNFENLAQETGDESVLKATFEQKFFFVFFQSENKKLILKKAMFWNMPFEDIQEAKKVWSKTKSLIRNGKIVKSIKTNNKGQEIRETYFPKKRSNKVSHVRPHARNAKDCFPLPIPDQLTKAKKYTKHCFWINNSYIAEKIYSE